MPVSYGIIKKKHTKTSVPKIKLRNLPEPQWRMGSPSHAASFLIWHCLWHSLPSDFESHDKNHLNGRRWRYLSNYDTPSTRQSKLTTFQPLIWPVLAHRGAEHTRVGYPGWEAKNIQVGLVNLYKIVTLRLFWQIYCLYHCREIYGPDHNRKVILQTHDYNSKWRKDT